VSGHPRVETRIYTRAGIRGRRVRDCRVCLAAPMGEASRIRASARLVARRKPRHKLTRPGAARSSPVSALPWS